MLKFLEGIFGFSNDGIDSRRLFRFLDDFFQQGTQSLF